MFWRRDAVRQQPCRLLDLGLGSNSSFYHNRTGASGTWPVALSSGWQRWAGICGGLLAIVPLAMLGTLDRAIDPLVLAEIIIFEAIWAMAAAIMLWSDRIRAHRAI